MKFNDLKLHFVFPGNKSYPNQLGKPIQISKNMECEHKLVFCVVISKIFLISYDWIKIWRISPYFTPVSHAQLKQNSGKLNTWNFVSQLSVHYKGCHKMLNMYLSQITCLNKQHVSSNIHVVNFVTCLNMIPPPNLTPFLLTKSNLFQSNTGPAVSSMCKKIFSDHANCMTEWESVWHTLKCVSLSFMEMKAQGLHRFTYTPNKKPSFLLCIIHITHKLVLTSRSFVFKAYENKAPNSVPKFMTEFTEQVNLWPDQELWYKSGLHFDTNKHSFQQNISFRLYTLLKTKILLYIFIYYYFHPFNHNICTLMT